MVRNFRRALLLIAMTALAAMPAPARADIVILRSDGSEAPVNQAPMWQDSQTGRWHIVLQALYAPSGVTLYEIRGNGGESIERIIINVPCWTGPNGQCVPAGSPVFVRVLSDPPHGISTVHKIEQTGTAETLLTHVIVKEDIGFVSAQAIGILDAGRDVLGPIVSLTPDNPHRGIAEVTAGRHVLGDLTALNGRIGSVHAGENIGSPEQPINITFKHNSLDIAAEEIHADIDTRIAGGNGHLWRMEADRFFGTLRTPHLAHHWTSGAPGMILIHEQLAGTIEIGGSLNDPAHVIELPLGGIEGQMTINADNEGGTWSAPIQLRAADPQDDVVLQGSDYATTSAQLGGGAVGVVPFALHHQSSSPTSGSTITNAADEPYPTIELEHYGPIHLLTDDAAVIERRAIGSGTFSTIPLDAFVIDIPGDDRKTLRISSIGVTSGFEPGYEYRITPTDALRSDVADRPAAIWNEPYLVTVKLEDDDSDDDGGGIITIPDGPGASCPGDLDNNGAVTVFDLLILLSQWGPCESCAADLENDGIVNVFDLLVLLANWGPC